MFMDLPLCRTHIGKLQWVSLPLLCSSRQSALLCHPFSRDAAAISSAPCSHHHITLAMVLGYRNILATFMAGCTACCLEPPLNLYFHYEEKIITFIPLKTEMFSFLKSYKEFCQSQLPFLFFLLP